MPAAATPEILHVGNHSVTVSNPGKILFPEAKLTKIDLVQYYLTVADGALRAAGGRPNMLVRYPNGIEGEFFYQKRAPSSRPDWLEVVALKFPSGRTAEELVPNDAAALAWMANLACLELHPHPVRADDLEHPDELRVDLDPVPGVLWDQVREVARTVRATLDDFSLVGWPKTSGSRGIHVYVRIERRWGFTEVRRAALAHVDVKFVRAVRPPVELTLRATLTRQMGGLWMFGVSADRGGEAHPTTTRGTRAPTRTRISQGRVPAAAAASSTEGVPGGPAPNRIASSPISTGPGPASTVTKSIEIRPTTGARRPRSHTTPRFDADQGTPSA